MRNRSGWCAVRWGLGVVLTGAVCAWGLEGWVATAQAGDMYIYPAKGQSKEQQDKDMYECHSWAVGQTGFDPTKPAVSSAPAAQEPRGGAVRGAAKGAALGAVGGAIAGDAGKGAAIGAAVGGTGGAIRQRRGREEEAAAQQQAAQVQQQSLEGYNRAKATCMEGRGYTVNQ